MAEIPKLKMACEPVNLGFKFLDDPYSLEHIALGLYLVSLRGLNVVEVELKGLHWLSFLQ